jgi:hypothetical protein
MESPRESDALLLIADISGCIACQQMVTLRLKVLAHRKLGHDLKYLLARQRHPVA